MAVNYERKQVEREVATLSIDYYTVAEVIRELQSIVERGYASDSAIIKRCHYEYGDGEYWAVTAMVDETDEEMRKRIALEEKYEHEQSVRDRLDFERLKAKFGG